MVIFIVIAAAFVYNIQYLFKLIDSQQKMARIDERIARIDEQERKYCLDSPTYREMFPAACERLLN